MVEGILRYKRLFLQAFTQDEIYEIPERITSILNNLKKDDPSVMIVKDLKEW